MALMMERVIDSTRSAVAPGAAVPGYRVAGKTGTAQRVGDECGCYDGTFTVSFAGFAPDRRPPVHDLRGDPGPAERWRWLGGRPGLLQADELRAAPLPGAADQHGALAPACLLVMREDHSVARRPRPTPAHRADRARGAGRRARARVVGAVDGVEVSGFSLSSQRVRPGDLYAALPGSRSHGIAFAAGRRRVRRGRGAHRPRRCRSRGRARGCPCWWSTRPGRSSGRRPPGSTATPPARCG